MREVVSVGHIIGALLSNVAQGRVLKKERSSHQYEQHEKFGVIYQSQRTHASSTTIVVDLSKCQISSRI